MQCARSSFALSRHGRRNWRFAAVLFGYFWTSALTKLVRPFLPTIGAHAQIYPELSDVVGNDPAQMGLWHWLVVVAGLGRISPYTC